MKRLLSLLTFILLNNIIMAQDTAPISFLALGDSYTIGESVSETERWPVQLAAELVERGYSVKSPKIIAKTGWRTDELMDAINADEQLAESYDLVSLLIGVNNQYQGKTVTSYEPEFEALLVKAIELAGGDADRVFVVSIPDYGKTPFGKEKREQIEVAIDKYNEVNKFFAKKYGVKYFNITPISRRAAFQENLVASDGLHPSGEMYTEWVDLMISKVARMLKK
ncbi:lysophospholipase L1-like esterase [Roseivirga pacifica]|uniref:Lysophospholipase L1 n=1 Tax=Roseivirga pacifica TaxID=1267423 RepID=A0A1I0QTQ5_9BACT|nr:SGNH/GDSL hydrolase family protein [Roseivirga pacifica]RKQ42592.1 lysophospholipase L1-like esterase [Roseivirga pacifica]SEW30658.1 Lysophospholipase L1 [Roseivirga pacifica]